jgi:protein involved in polysaccharide export with SLBB domain
MKKYASSIICVLLALLAAGYWSQVTDTAEQTTVFPPDAAVTLFGQVHRQGKYPLKQGMTLKELVRQAGGVSQFANTKMIRVENSRIPVSTLRRLYYQASVRYNQAADVIIDHTPDWLGDLIPLLPETSPNVRTAVNLKGGEDTELQPGDVVIIRELTLNF